jgi:hypothetical protein
MTFSGFGTKQRSIFTKEMLTALPGLLWLPGDFCQFRWNESDDAPIIAQFRQSAFDFRVISVMIYAEATPLCRITLFTFSTPLLTLLFDPIRNEQPSGFTLPRSLLDILNDSRLIVVYPGPKDWHSTSAHNHLTLLEDLLLIIPNFKNVKTFHELELSLHIQPSVTQLCSHLRMIRWLFQITFESQLHGTRQQSWVLTQQWKTLTDHYGKLLIYFYWRLEEKQRVFDENSGKGLDLSPLYLEHLLRRHGIEVCMEEKDLRQKLIGTASYPKPPLPRL